MDLFYVLLILVYVVWGFSCCFKNFFYGINILDYEYEYDVCVSGIGFCFLFVIKKICN